MASFRKAFAVTHGRSFEKRFGPVGGGFSFKLSTLFPLAIVRERNLRLAHGKF
jgi:hypothetical protein